MLIIDSKGFVSEIDADLLSDYRFLQRLILVSNILDLATKPVYRKEFLDGKVYLVSGSSAPKSLNF